MGLIVAMSVLCASAGCSGRAGPKRVYPVAGKLTYQGQPMDRAQITFRLLNDPNPRTLGILAHADANGEYKATTYKHFDGLAAGEYVVTLQWPEARPRQIGTEAVSEEDLPPDRLRGAYADPATSKLRATVGIQANQIDFALP
jgi:hypothetical protein